MEYAPSLWKTCLLGLACTTVCLVLLVKGGGFGLGMRCSRNVHTDMIAIILDNSKLP